MLACAHVQAQVARLDVRDENSFSRISGEWIRSRRLLPSAARAMSQRFSHSR
jgi:hypothetical protein